MPYEVSHLITLEELKQTAQVFKTESDKALKSISVSGRTISFFTSEDGSGTAATTVDIPKDLFLDQARTKFESNFEFTASKYPGAVNPSLDGKPVFVLAVKGTSDPEKGTADDTISYSFLDMATLVDTYTVEKDGSEKILDVSGYKLKFKISKAENNAITVKDDGVHVDISGKADKVENATADHLPALDANGNLTDSGIVKSQVVKKSEIASMDEVKEMLTEVGFTVPSGE